MNVNLRFFIIVIAFQELSKKQQQLEQAHSMLLRHHEKTQDLEYRQQKSVHALREDQVSIE
jgi:thousand and one amino acid protein kinase